jgi:hypothetical protein
MGLPEKEILMVYIIGGYSQKIQKNPINSDHVTFQKRKIWWFA